MEIYDVTVSRIGIVRVPASSKLEAKIIADTPEIGKKIEWLDEWVVTDVDEVDPTGTLGITV